MAEKRKRGQNFTIEEKDRLIKLLRQHRSTILNKKTDGTTNEAKLLAWTSLANKFNCSGSNFRTKESLMKQWEKLKSEAKLYHGKNQKGIIGTGGGPCTTKSDPVLDQVCDILGRACSGMVSVNDSDAHIAESGATESNMFANIDTEFEVFEVEHNLDDDTTPDIPIDKENPPLWSRRRRPRLSSKNERSDALLNITTSICNVQEKKLTYEEVKVQILEDEKKFKDKLYALQLEAAKKDLAIKEEILKQLQGGGLSSDNIIGLGRKKTNED